MQLFNAEKDQNGSSCFSNFLVHFIQFFLANITSYVYLEVEYLIIK
jgi:hypothetical protein